MSDKVVFNDKGVERVAELFEQFKDAVSEKISNYSGNALPTNSVFFVDSVNWKNGVIEIVVKNSARLDWEQLIKINTEQLRLRANGLAKLIKNKNLIGENKTASKKKATKPAPKKESTATVKPTPKKGVKPKKKVPIKKAKV